MAIPIFYYHSVGGPEPQTVPLEIFRRHLDLLIEEGYVTVTFRDFLAGKLPDVDPQRGIRGIAVLTFDDGLLDNFEIAYPELKRRRMVGTFFVVPGYDQVLRYVNPSDGRWSDRPRPGYTIEFRSMNAEHRRIMADDGMEIGCHTQTHRRLTRLSPSEHEAEIAGAKRHLEAELGRSVDTFCYPFGRFNRAVLEGVRRAGYLGAASTIPGYERHVPAHPFRCRRLLIYNPHYFREVLRGNAFSPAAFVRSARAFGRWRFFQ